MTVGLAGVADVVWSLPMYVSKEVDAPWCIP